MNRIHLAVILGWLFCNPLLSFADEGKIDFKPITNQADIPAEYRLKEQTFQWKMTKKYELPISQVEVYNVEFPSPVQSPYEANNTVHAEYYRPMGKGPFPGVIILDVLGGDQKLSRGMGLFFAQNQIAGLFVQMAYYGPRRPPEGIKLLSKDIPRTLDGVRQTVLDCRFAAAWLAAREEIDAKHLGIVGTSLGSFMSALTGAMEPRLERVALLLSGGDLVDVYWDHPKAKPYTQWLNLIGNSKQRMKDLIAPVDPITYAALLKKRKLLMIAASRDDVVPPEAAKKLWQATGKQTIHWFDTNHLGAAFYIFDAMEPVLKHFKAE